MKAFISEKIEFENLSNILEFSQSRTGQEKYRHEDILCAEISEITVESNVFFNDTRVLDQF